MSNIELVGLTTTSVAHLGEDAGAILLTPSTPIGEHPLADSTPPVLAYDVDREPISINTALSTLSNDGKMYCDLAGGVSPPVDIPGTDRQEDQRASLQSSSSGSSTLHDATPSATLLTSHHFINDANFQENGAVKQGYYTFQLGNGKTPPYGFISWNWPIIRKLCFCGVVSTMVACLCVVIAFITMLPITCDPPKEWYQGSLFYEIFPASFQDTNGDGVGDIKGINMRVPYLKSLKVKCVHLNSIFAADHYPEFYKNIRNFTQIDASLGSIDDMDLLIRTLHENDISIILDIPLHNFIFSSDDRTSVLERNATATPSENNVSNETYELTTDSSQKTISRINSVDSVLNFWLDLGVDGFYLKDLELLTDSPFFIDYISTWKETLRYYSTFLSPKIIMCSNKVLTRLINQQTPDQMDRLVTVFKSFNLIDVLLDISSPSALRSHIDSVLKGETFSKMDYPWIHWSMGNVDTPRMATKLEARNTSVAALFINLILPGTPSIFYGDEVGLTNINDIHEEFSDLNHVHQLPPMHWTGGSFSAMHNSWLPKSQALMPNHVGAIVNILEMRDNTPSLYTRATIRNNEIFLNCAVDRNLDEYLIAVERTYPRRNSVVLITNLRNEGRTMDFSSLYFGGYVLGGVSHYPKGQYLQFHSLTIYTGETLFIKLDK